MNSKPSPRELDPAAPIKRYFEYNRNLAQMVLVSTEGIRVLVQTATVFSEFREQVGVEGASTLEATGFYRDKKKLGELATSETKEGFPILMAQAAVGLWGALEVAVEDTMVALLLSEPELLERKEFSKIRIPLAEFHLMDEEERVRFLVSELERDLGAGRKRGIDVFEGLLSVVGLGGAVGDDVKKAIREWHGLRNVIVHRDSIVDRHLISACPWLGLKVGERVVANFSMLVKYSDAGREYLKTVLGRIDQRGKGIGGTVVQ